MFDLEARIRVWRQSLAQTLGPRPEVLEELESHLREELSRLTLAGQMPEEAWNMATSRLGSPEQLSEEFGKLPARPLRWVPGVIVLVLYTLVTLAFFLPMVARLRDGNASGLLVAHVSSILAGYLATFAFGALAIWATFQRLWGGWTTRRAECLRSWGWGFSLVGAIGCSVGVFLGALWSRDNLGAFWTHDPREIGGVALILWNLFALWLLPRQGRPIWTDLILGLGGNVAVAFGWFVAGVLVARVNAHGMPGDTALVIFLKVFLLAHAVLLALALLPLRSRDGVTPDATS